MEDIGRGDLLDHGIEPSSAVFDRWMGKADENIEEWGLQDERTLLLAMQEELGELTQAVLEASAEGGEAARIDEELDDLGALLLQFHEARNSRSEGTGTDR
jgi:NTP pyrophosphatase (non-canonical NTP hydrolase)